MEQLNGIKWTKLLKILLIKIFSSELVAAIVNIVIPAIISILGVKYNNSIYWWISILCLMFVIISFNVTTVIIKNKINKRDSLLNIISRCFYDQMLINEKAANNIYRLNKRIAKYTKENKQLVNKSVFDQIADFQTISFTICESIHKMLTSEYGKEIKCEVTLMKKNIKTSKINMIAFSNNDNKAPSTYNVTYNTKNSDDSNILFVKLFGDLNAEIKCIPDREQVRKSFIKLNGSEKREGEICQYIGIPIKTNRKNIELLLQIDVSKENIFGKTSENMLSFAKNVLYPYAVLLHKSYERDLIFNQYYDLIVSTLPLNSSNP